MRCLLSVGLALWVLLGRSDGAAPARPASEFTSTDLRKAQLLDRSAGNASYLCGGVGIYQVLLQSSEGRSWLDLLVGETVVSLSRGIFEVCPGANPRTADAVVEWRGYRRGKQFTPYALCFRMASEDPRDKAVRETVVVVKLNGAQSRVVGQLGAQETKEAIHAMADRLCLQP